MKNYFQTVIVKKMLFILFLMLINIHVIWAQTDSTKIIVTFNVSVPEITPEEDTVYIVGSFNDWDPAEIMMTKVAPYSWQLEMLLDRDSIFEYKYSRGSWETVEKDEDSAEIDNRIVSTESISLSIEDEVANWADLRIPSDPENISPFLSYYNNSPQTSIAITWASDSLSKCFVHYGIENVNENIIVVSEHKGLIEETDNLIHIARLADLIPNTLYQYTVETEGVFQSDTFSFKTAHEETDFMFIVGGDNQLDLIEPVLDSIIVEDPDFMLHCGDLVVDGVNTKEWYKFQGRFKEFTGNYVMLPVYGNHEEDSPTMAKLFQHPVNNSIDSTDEGHWFSFDYNNVHITGLDVQRDYAPSSEQYQWLLNDLQNIDDNIDHRIVYFHQPAYCSSGYHGPNNRVREYLEPLLIEYGVDLVFSGHNHHYERSLANGITYITTGGLGLWLKDFDMGSNPWSVFAEKINHYCRVSVKGPDIKVEMVRQDGTIGDVYESLKVDGNDRDWLFSGIEPLLDTDKLQTDSELKLERLFITQDENNFYFGFDAPAINKGVSYGIYIDIDNVPGSGGTSDRWGKAIATENDHLPEIQIYAFHDGNDSWSSSSPKYYSWDTISLDWVSATGGMGSLPEGSIYNVDTTNRFFEMAIPKNAPGFNGVDNFYVELFTVGESNGAGASESIPSDSTIQFTVENTSTDITYLTAFHGFNITIPTPPNSDIIKIDGNPDDWKENNIVPLATDTDNFQDGTAYKMDSLYVHMDSTNVYFGFVTPAEFTGLHYGIYIDTDSLEGSGGTSDKWQCDVTAVNKHLPDIAIYAYHGDDGGWSSSSPKYYTWSGSTWTSHSGGEGSLPAGGLFAHNSDLDFVEILIPKDAPGFENINSFYISLFNFGGDKFVCETIPSDPAVKFTGENSSTTVEISNFAFFPIESITDLDQEILYHKFFLKQNYPNPFQHSTRINYSLNQQANVSIKVYNAMGKLVMTLMDESQNAGNHHVILDGNNMSSGIYFYQLKSGDFRITKKLIFIN